MKIEWSFTCRKSFKNSSQMKVTLKILLCFQRLIVFCNKNNEKTNLNNKQKNIVIFKIIKFKVCHFVIQKSRETLLQIFFFSNLFYQLKFQIIAFYSISFYTIVNVHNFIQKIKTLKNIHKKVWFSWLLKMGAMF